MPKKRLVSGAKTNFLPKIGIVKLSKKRFLHIIQHHPIMEDYLTNLRDVLEKPEEIRFSSRNDEVLLFYHYFAKIEGGKYIIAVVNKTERDVKTAYISHRIKLGRKYEENKEFST